MPTVVEVEKIAISPIQRKRFRSDEVSKMVEAGILPEESGWELIDGYLVDKMTVGSKHASVVRRLSKMLERNYGDIVQVSGQNPVHINDHNEPEPNIALLKPREDFYADSHPTAADVLLLIEVADSSVDYDRDIKKTLYAEAGVVEFWLVSLKDTAVEVYTQPKNGNYRLARILEAGESVEAAAIENLTLRVEEILGL